MGKKPVAWTLQDINIGWLRSASNCAPSLVSRIVQAYNDVDATLGRDWIVATHSDATLGCYNVSAALRVCAMAAKLFPHENVQRARYLIDRVRANDASALSELTAVHMLRRDHTEKIIELEPLVVVDNFEKKPDFRIRGSGAWIYVEVTAKYASAIHTERGRITTAVVNARLNMRCADSIEVRFAKPPSDVQISNVIELLRGLETDRQTELPEKPGWIIPRLLGDDVEQAQIVPDDLTEPRLQTFGTRIGDPPLCSRISVSVPYVDERSVNTVETEAAQLADGFANLIMVDVSHTACSEDYWRHSIEAEFNAGRFKPISTVCTFREFEVLTEAGRRASDIRTSVISNATCPVRLPTWIEATLQDPNPSRGVSIPSSKAEFAT